MATVALLYVPCPSARVAHTIASFALTHHLAACANISTGKSMHRERKKITRATEAYLLLKTAPRAVARLRRAIEERHPYDTPCILELRADANPAFAAWVSRDVW